MFSFRKNCPKEITDLIERYLLSRLSDHESQHLEKHLLRCPRCMDIFEEFEQFLTASREARGRRRVEVAPAAI